MRATLVAMAFVVSAWMVMGDETVMILDNNVSVAPWDKEFKFTVPPFSVEHQVRLSFEVRIESDRLKGSNHWLQTAVNGTWLTDAALLNKPNDFKTQKGVDLVWFKNGAWRVLYSPDFQAAIVDTANPYACPDADPYRFVLDITPYVQPGENTLRLVHLKVLEKPSTMVLHDVKVEVGRPIARPQEEAVTPAPTGPLPTFVARGPQEVQMQVELAAGGAIRLAVGDRKLVVTTRTSLPGGQWHETDPAAAAEQIGRGRSAEAAWDSGSYRIQRRVTVLDDHVHVADTVTNTGDALAANMTEHHVRLDEPPVEARLAGTKAYTTQMQAHESSNPSTYAQWPDMGLGIVAEDDVLRAHNRCFLSPESFGIADDRLGLAPGASLTQEWSLYPTPGGDYWDFVNAVRRNWGSNFTIPGSFVFGAGLQGDHPAEWYGQWATSRGLKIICGGIANYTDGKYAHGTGIMFAPEWVAAERDWVQKMQQTAPEVWPVCYFHCFCCTEPDGETKYRDSRMMNAQGEHISYPYSYRLPLYVPTRENSYGKAIWGFVDTILDSIGAAGVYWDEMSHSVLWYVYDMPWDGCSLRIDPETHEVAGTITCVPLITQPLRLDIVHHIREQGKFLMANTQAATRAMHEERIVRFVETGSYSALDATHLECPLGLGNHDAENTPGDAARHVREQLEHGALYYGHHYLWEPAEWNFASVMYPITPVEIREGMVLGEERIHTARSGRYGFPDGAKAVVYVIGGDGMRVAEPDVAEEVVDGRHIYEIRMPSDNFAVLVRSP